MNIGELNEKVKKALMPRREIIAAYLYGSTAKGSGQRESDIDIGVLVEKGFKPTPLYEASLALEIEKSLKAKDKADVRVLNNREIIFLQQVLKNGKLLFSKSERERISFETGVYKQYLDFKPFFFKYNEIRRRRLLA